MKNHFVTKSDKFVAKCFYIFSSLALGLIAVLVGQQLAKMVA